MHHTPRHRRPSSAANLTAAGHASTADVALALVCALCAVPGVVVLLVDQLPGTPVIGLALLVPGAVVVGGERLSRSTGGPDIHDRQLDRIIAGAAAAIAVAAIAVAVAPGGPALGSALVLATPLFVIGVIALLLGTRRLWQQRAVPLLLFAAWPAPWVAALHPVGAALDPAVLTGALAGLIGMALVVLVIAPRCVLRSRARRDHRVVRAVSHRATPAISVRAAGTPAPVAVKAAPTTAARTVPAIVVPGTRSPDPAPVGVVTPLGLVVGAGAGPVVRRRRAGDAGRTGHLQHGAAFAPYSRTEDAA